MFGNCRVIKLWQNMTFFSKNTVFRGYSSLWITYIWWSRMMGVMIIMGCLLSLLWVILRIRANLVWQNWRKIGTKQYIIWNRKLKLILLIKIILFVTRRKKYFISPILGFQKAGNISLVSVNMGLKFGKIPSHTTILSKKNM